LARRERQQARDSGAERCRQAAGCARCEIYFSWAESCIGCLLWHRWGSRDFYKAKELTGGTASFEPIDVLANDTTVMVWGRFRGARNGNDFEINHAYYYRFDEHGRFIEGHTIPADQHLANQLWS
jgi:hypothetical protein